MKYSKMAKKVRFSKNGHFLESYIFPPCQCPYCDKIVEVKIIEGFCKEDECGYHGILITECPSCNKYSATLYNELLESFQRDAAYPYQQLPNNDNCDKIIVPEEISAISPDFQNLLDQAAKAECSGLEDLAAIGYRRALEFLVKDYCIFAWPGDTETIKNSTLHATILKLQEISPIIENIAKKIKDIGNDHTHYIKRYPYTYKEMKRLILILIPFLQGAIGLTQEL